MPYHMMYDDITVGPEPDPQTVFEAFGHNQHCEKWDATGPTVLLCHGNKCTCGGKEADDPLPLKE